MVDEMATPPTPSAYKNKPYHALKRLFEKKKGGFLKNDLRSIIKSDEFFEFISQVDSFESETRFLWKVEQFPYSDNADNTDFVDLNDTAEMVDTVLAIAKTAELCAVISMTDKHDIWYRLYENTATYEGFGTLRYAYIQHFFYDHSNWEWEVHTAVCDSIFILYNEHAEDAPFSFDGDLREDISFKRVNIQTRQHDVRDGKLKIHNLSITETDDDGHPFRFSFKDWHSDVYYRVHDLVCGYSQFISYRPEDRDNNFTFGYIPFLRDSHRRPVGLITWEVNPTQDALTTSIVRSFMCQIK
jgi:hypothetical protein